MSDRRTDFEVRPNVYDGKTDSAEYLAGLIYLDVSIGDDGVSGWVRPEVAQTIKAAFGKPVLAARLANESRATFAAMAMQGMVTAITRLQASGIIVHRPQDVAEISKVYADALLAELAK
jgi:hypothetical protein